MDITFAQRKMAKAANNDKTLSRELGPVRGKKLKQRLDQLSSATTLEDLRHAPGRFHELVENHKGKWSCDLDHPYRLIFKPHQQPIPTNADGKYIWAEITGVEIVDVIDYH